MGAVKAGERLFPARWLPLDYRFAVLGGLLPDIVDKPLKWYLFPSLPDDHLWAHTLWFSAILIGLGLVIGARTCDSRVLLLGLGALTHLIFDPVATDPRTLFWPLFGSMFPHPSGYWFKSPIPGPVIDVLIVGALLLALQSMEPLRRRLSAFVQTGAV